MNFLKGLVDSFIPHADNAYKPRFFRAKALAFVAACILALAAGAFALQTVMLQNSGSLAAVVSAVLVNLANTDRSANEVPALSTNALLAEAARMKADDMAATSYFAHVSPAGVTPWHWFQEAGYRYRFAGENLAVRFSDSLDVEKAWMNSPDHRANILSPHFTEIGIATAEGNYEGQPAIFVVEMFGAPAAAAGASLRDSSLGVGTPTPKAPAPAAAAGASVAAAPRVIAENANFIAVENTASAGSKTSPAPAPAGVSAATFFTSPQTVVTYAYFFIAALIALALVLMIVVEFRHQHPRNALIAVVLLALIAAVFFFWGAYFPGQLVIG